MSEQSKMDVEYERAMGDLSQELQGCEPDFLIISPPKTGTTWLSQNLSSHPEIYIPAIKEIHYFSVYWREFDINWYLRHFQKAGLRRKGDATPYADLPLYVIRGIKRRFPRLKLIFLMRDPIERAWSQTKHDYRFRQGTFSDYSGSFEEIPDQKFIQNLTAVSSVKVGDYLLCLKRWLSCFDREQIFLGFFEPIKSDPETLFRQVLNHLDVKSDVDLSSFPISDRIFPGIEKEIPIRLKPYLKAIYAQKTRELIKFLKEQFQISPPSEWDATAAADELDPLLLEEDYKGNQLLLYRSKCYALPAEHERLVSGKDGKRLIGNLICGEYLTGNSLDELMNYVDRGKHESDPESYLANVHMSYLDELFSRPSLQLTSSFGFSVFLFQHRFYALSHRLLPSNSALIHEHLLLEYQEAGMCYVAESLDELQNILVSLGSPVVVQESYRRFNVVEYRKIFYGVVQSLGPFDLTGLDQRTLSLYVASGQIVTAGSLEKVIRAIDELVTECTPVLVLEGYLGFNIVAYRRKHYGFVQWLGVIDVSQLDEPTLEAYESAGQAVVAGSLEETKRRIRECMVESTPVLLIEGYCGFNIVWYQKKHYGFAQATGPLDLTQLDEQSLGSYQSTGQAVVASSLEEVKRWIEDRMVETVPILALEGYMGFNIVRYQKNYLGMAQSLGPVDLTTTDQQTLDIYQKQGQCVIAGSLSMARCLIDRMPPIPA